MVIRVFMCLIYLAAYLFSLLICLCRGRIVKATYKPETSKTHSLKPEHQGGFGLRSLSLPDAPPAEKGVGKRGGVHWEV